jgi:hypothetical protein
MVLVKNDKNPETTLFNNPGVKLHSLVSLNDLKTLLAVKRGGTARTRACTASCQAGTTTGSQPLRH